MGKKRALISVSDKSGIIEFAQGLVANGFEILSTGGTKRVLEAAGIPTIGVEEVTEFPEMMEGRVKTLHPKIHGGLLGRLDVPTDQEAMLTHAINPITVLCVNLYPFKETILKSDVTTDEAIENIDIGGPSMLRSGAKNHSFVTVLVDPNDYPHVLMELTDNGNTSFTTRQRLAAKVFRHTAAYDALIASYFTELVEEQTPESFTITYQLKQALRYGENSHQQAVFYEEALPTKFSIAQAEQLHGKELSYNNIKDADAAIRIIREFQEPTVVAVKHMNPCGVGVGATIEEAYLHAYSADPISIFGGIIALNREVDLATAEKLHELFLEMIIAPHFSQEAFECLASKKNLRLLTIDFAQQTSTNENELVSVLGGVLVQEQDVTEDDPHQWSVVTKRVPTKEELEALAFAWKIVKHVKSNAIVLATKDQTIGIGAGQMNRVGAVQIALAQAGEKAEGAVMASDAFFPMSDSVEYAATHGIKAIVQPGGSIKDQESIEMADNYGIAMVFTAIRHFRH